jgi:hypothetical protein
MAGFASTVAFFEKRAETARDPEDKRRLLEAAGFYRRIADIVPGFPPGFKPSGYKGYANRWKARAEECRTIADNLTDRKCREQMRKLAEEYERMAAAAE